LPADEPADRFSGGLVSPRHGARSPEVINDCFLDEKAIAPAASIPCPITTDRNHTIFRLDLDLLKGRVCEP